MKLSEIAKRIGAQLVGEDVEITGMASIGEAESGQLTFIANPKYKSKIKQTRASAVIVSEDFPEHPATLSLLRVRDPYFAFAQALELFAPDARPPSQIHPTALIGAHTTLGEGVFIGAYTFIDEECEIGDRVIIHAHCTICRGVSIGADSVIHSHCTIRENTRIGRRVIIQDGARIGTDGFGYAKDSQGKWYKIPQLGRVVIDDGVEIGANTTIDRAAMGETRICSNAKLDNLVQIGHSSIVGENSLLCAQVGLAGTTTLGKNVILAGQVGVAGHLTIGDNAVATAQSGIPSSVKPHTVVSGSPAINNREWLRASAVFRRLPDLYERIRILEEKIRRLEGRDFNVKIASKDENTVLR